MFKEKAFISKRQASQRKTFNNDEQKKYFNMTLAKFSRIHLF